MLVVILNVFVLVDVMLLIGCFRLRWLIRFWNCLWFLVKLIVLGEVLRIGMLVVLSEFVSFSGV